MEPQPAAEQGKEAAARALPLPPPPPPRALSPERQDAMEEDEQAVAFGATPLSPPSTLSSERKPVVEQEAAAAVGAPPPPPLLTPPRGAPSGSGGSSGCEPAVAIEDEAIRDLARMIALHGHDPSIVEDDYFRSFVRHLNPGFHLPSRRDVENMCDVIFDQAMKDVQETRLCNIQVRPSLTVGKAKTIDGEVLYTACHFIDDEWNLHKVVMDTCVIVPDHPWHGPLLGVPEVSLADPLVTDFSVCHVLKEAIFRDRGGIDDRILMVACGLTNDPWINEFIERKISKDYLSIPGLFCTQYMDNVLHSIARCLSVPHLRDLYDRASGHSDFTRQKRETLLSDRGLEDIRAFNERWYSCYCSSEVLRAEAPSITTDGESDIIIQLMCKLWGAIYRAIKTISASRSPTSNLCLVELFKVREVLQSAQECAREANDESTEGVLKKAEETLEKALRGSYLVWFIPLVLDPRYKLESVELIFKSVFGSNCSYYSDVTRNLKKLYSTYCEGGHANVLTVDDADPWQHVWDEHRNANAQAKTDLDRYLKDEPIPKTEGFDILNWWKVHGSDHYPTLAPMARDVLAIPTCSKLSSEQIAQVRSILRGYSVEKYKWEPYWK